MSTRDLSPSSLRVPQPDNISNPAVEDRQDAGAAGIRFPRTQTC